MPPTPVDPENVLLDPSALPRFHLRCLDLNHPGTEVFFDLTSSPSVVLAVPASRVLHLLYPPESSESLSTGPPAVRSITLHLHAFDGVAYTCGSELDNEHKELHLSLSYVEGVAQRSTDTGHRRVGDEIEGVLTHELVHAFQYNGRGTVPGGVIEGIADWVRYQAGFAPPHWREEPREGDRWDAGYERTGFFLAFLSRHLDDPHLVPQLNAALRDSEWGDGEPLRALLGGKDVEELWVTYCRSVRKEEEEGGAEAPAPVPTHGPRAGYGVQY